MRCQRLPGSGKNMQLVAIKLCVLRIARYSEKVMGTKPRILFAQRSGPALADSVTISHADNAAAQSTRTRSIAAKRLIKSSREAASA